MAGALIYVRCMNFANRIRAIRGASSQDDFALTIGVKQPTVSRWEAGVNCPDVRDVPALAEKMGLPMLERARLIEAAIAFVPPTPGDSHE